MMGAQTRNISSGIVSLIGALILIGVLIWLIIAVSVKFNFKQNQHKIVTEARYFISQCRDLSDRPFNIKGKCLIWDLASDKKSYADELLSTELRASTSDSVLTIFLITYSIETPVITYKNGNRGYRRDTEICVVYWPEKQAVSSHKIVSTDPPAYSSYKSGEAPKENGNGDYLQRLATWIEYETNH